MLGGDLLALGLGFFIEKLIFLFRAVYGAQGWVIGTDKATGLYIVMPVAG